VDTVEYAAGRAADVHPGTTSGHVLLWHGRGPNERGVLATLAGLVAARGPTVIVADWSSEADDGGRADLLRSLRFARETVEAADADSASLVLVGWSLGGTAAAGVTIHARRLGVAVAHTVCLAGGFIAPDPISGDLLTGQIPDGDGRSPFTLVHGIADDMSPVTTSRAFGQALELAQWPVELVEVPTDHGGIVGVELDPSGWSPATNEATRAVAAGVAGRIAALTSSS
jgi:dienelactone hydrolase